MKEREQVVHLLFDDNVWRKANGGCLQYTFPKLDEGLRADEKLFQPTHNIENFPEFRLKWFGRPKFANLESHCKPTDEDKYEEKREYQKSHFLDAPGEQGIGSSFVDIKEDGFGESPMVNFGELVMIEIYHEPQGKNSGKEDHCLRDFFTFGNIAFFPLFV